MSIFEMVKYHNQIYPTDISLRLEECAANFDITSIESDLEISLHTEYSYGKRKMNSEIISRFPTIVMSQKAGIPQLWKSEQWTQEFADFIFSLAGQMIPKVIEVHPPFTDYCTFDDFFQNYRIFEERIFEKYSNVEILIENRCGSVYHGGKFLVSQNKDVERLCDGIVQHHLCLKVAYDIPQIYTAHHVKKPEKYIELLLQAEAFRQHIGGVHLWGKRISAKGRKVAHCGDLNSYFIETPEVKKAFLRQFATTFDDSVVRKMVLEVNSGNDDLLSIVSDLRKNDIQFL